MKHPNDIDDAREPGRVSRRASLLRAGGIAASVLGAGAAPAAADEKAGGGPAAVASGAITCVLAPEMTQGPYYLPNQKIRRDITGGMPGTPLALRLTVVSSTSCKGIKGAAVDIWHADAAGAYSGEQANGTVGRTFLRGIQRTNEQGLAAFTTVYPGWYPGRAVHIHVIVHVGGSIIHTGQLFFPDTLSDRVYKSTPYSTRGPRDVRNPADSIYRNGGSKSTLNLHKTATGYAGAISMGIHHA